MWRFMAKKKAKPKKAAKPVKPVKPVISECERAPGKFVISGNDYAFRTKEDAAASLGLKVSDCETK